MQNNQNIDLNQTVTDLAGSPTELLSFIRNLLCWEIERAHYLKEVPDLKSPPAVDGKPSEAADGG